MSRITTVIFDMYDTLVQNPQHFVKKGFEKIIKEQVLYTDPDRLWQEWSTVESEFRATRVKPEVPFRTYYQSWRDSFSHAFTALGITGDPDSATSSFINHISRRDPYPETKEALRTVQAIWRTAVLSNADDDFLLPNLKLLGVEFEAVLSSEEARVYKPLPGLFLQMLRRLNVAPDESVYVGDRQYEDVQGSSDVGMNAIWINRSGAALDPQLPAPACQIRSLLELPDILTAWPPAEDSA